MTGRAEPFDAETVLRNIQGPLFVVEDDAVVFCNERFFEISHLGPEDVPGAHITELDGLIEEGFSDFRAAYEAVSAGESAETRVEMGMHHPAAAPVPERLPAEARVTPMEADGDAAGALVVLRNISTRKQHEQELRRQTERMEEVLNVVSHDLRNPLNVAEGRLELARTDCESEHFEPVLTALDRMQTLIDDLLTLAREGETVEETDRIALAAIARESWATVETFDATLRTDTDRTIAAARSRLQQLLENLFRNAIDHGGESVTVTVGDLSDGSGFYVADDGRGIPTEKRDLVLESGFTTSEHGTGFGLSIVQEVAEAHGWTIALDESADGGVRVEVAGVEFVD